MQNSSSNKQSVEIKFGKETFYIANVESYEQLEESVVKKTGVAPDGIKLVWKGRILTQKIFDEFTINSPILVIGSSDEKILEIEHGAEEYQVALKRRRERDVINDLDLRTPLTGIDETDFSTVLGSNISEINPNDGSQIGFGRLQTLSGFADDDKAKNILNRLARDLGIRDVMRRHKWYVPTLAEMPPDGKVGVDPICVLGLNENKGQRILLRLRTDDLQGFRKFLNIKQVLYHELAHNERSQHDAIFYGLVSRIQRQAENVTARAKSNMYRLGGQPHFPIAQRQEKQTYAIAQRLGDTPDHFDGGHEEEKHCVGQQSSSNQTPLEKSTEPKKETSPNQDITPQFISSPPESFCEPSSRQAKILEATRALSSATDPKSLRDAATTLQVILNNAALDDQKYKRVRLKNKLFMRTAGKFAAALRFLEACGFNREQENNEEILVLRRQDPGLLWCGRSALESIVAC